MIGGRGWGWGVSKWVKIREEKWSQDGWWEERGKTMRGESKKGWGSDRETDPNKTICREGLDDKTRCLIKGGMSDFLVFRHSLPDSWLTAYTPQPPLSFNLLILSATLAWAYKLTLLSDLQYHPTPLMGHSSSDSPESKDKRRWM